MKTDNDLDKNELVAAIRDQWRDLDLTRLEFTPRGEDGYNYIGWAGDARRWFVKLYRPLDARRFEFSLRVSRQLNDAGYDHAAPPILAAKGETHGEFAGYAVVAFDFIDGASLYPDYSKPYGADASDDEFAAMGDVIAGLHDATKRISYNAGHTEPFGWRYEQTLRMFLDGDADIAPINDWQREVVALWDADRANIRATFDRFRALSEVCRARERSLVITHGDAHLDNIMRNRDGRYHLIDWTDAAFAPPERDLTFYTGERFELFLERYLAARDPGPLDVDVFAFYLYQWVVCEIGCYTERLIFKNSGRLNDEQNKSDFEEFRKYVPVRQQDWIECGIEEIRGALTRNGVALIEG